jgi:hypothetical protein
MDVERVGFTLPARLRWMWKNGMALVLGLPGTRSTCSPAILWKMWYSHQRLGYLRKM